MNKTLSVVIGAIIVLALACSSGTAVPTPTSIPDTATPPPAQEWQLEDIQVDGNTVRVALRVFAGIDVDVTMDGEPPSRVDAAVPIIAYVFDDLESGEHQILMSDVAGYSQTESVSVIIPRGPGRPILPEWLTKWVAELNAGEVEFPPLSITKYQYEGETVYFVVKQCCDQFSDLLDADGNLIGHPNGGITGQGDGKTFFSTDGQKGEGVWSAP